MPATAKRLPLFQWKARTGAKSAPIMRFAFYRLDSANPFQAATYQLVRESPDPIVVGLYTEAQYKATIARVIERKDCEVL